MVEDIKSPRGIMRRKPLGDLQITAGVSGYGRSVEVCPAARLLEAFLGHEDRGVLVEGLG